MSAPATMHAPTLVRLLFLGAHGLAVELRSAGQEPWFWALPGSRLEHGPFLYTFEALGAFATACGYTFEQASFLAAEKTRAYAGEPRPAARRPRGVAR